MPYDTADIYQQLLGMIQSPQGVAPAQYDRSMVDVGAYDSSGDEAAADAEAAGIMATSKAYGDAGTALKKRYDDSKKAQAQYDFLKAQGVALPESAKPKGFWEGSPVGGAVTAISDYFNPSKPQSPTATSAKDIQKTPGIVAPTNPVKPDEVASPSPTSSTTPTGSSLLDLRGPTSMQGGTFNQNLKKYGQIYSSLFGPGGYFSGSAAAGAGAGAGAGAAGGAGAAAGGEAAAGAGAAAAM